MQALNLLMNEGLSSPFEGKFYKESPWKKSFSGEDGGSG